MTPFVTMRRAVSDEHLLGAALGGDRWLAWRILLIAAMGEPLTEEERAIFAKLTGREWEPGERVDEMLVRHRPARRPDERLELIAWRINMALVVGRLPRYSLADAHEIGG